MGNIQDTGDNNMPSGIAFAYTYNTFKNIWQFTKKKAGNGYDIMKNSITDIYAKCHKKTPDDGDLKKKC